MASDDVGSFEQAFEAVTGNRPFPWQAALYTRLRDGEIPTSCDIPTGLGKTSVIAVWLIALAHGANVPRRLVYVVNRRTVVDQTTNVAIKLRENAPKIGVDNLAISTLRGQFADNREWSADPSRPAVICGTVDMIGSRLLFSGYRIGFRSRPLHAGFLGQDALIVHDEAHLEPAFQELLCTIEKEQGRCGDFHPIRVMELTATSRRRSDKRVGLSDHDCADEIVRKRIEANKAIHLHPIADEKKLADEIARIALTHKSDSSVLVFVRRVDDVDNVTKKLAKGTFEQLTGTMRGKERDELVRTPIFQRFLPPSGREDEVTPAKGTVYLVCTSAGEVGIDMSADHMVCDLSTFESMAQRFGRVNRFGKRHDTRIDVVHPAQFDDKDKLKDAREATLRLLHDLNGDASPLNLSKLDPEARSAAFAPMPTILPATDILFDAWALTSVRQAIPGRPPVEPYLHGIAEWEPPQTNVAWREEVEIVTDEVRDRHRPSDLLDDYPLKPHELLRDRSDRVFKHIETLAKRHADTPVWIVDDRDAIEVTTLAELADKRRKDRINGCTILLPPSAGGLAGGMLDSTSDKADDVADEWHDENKERRRARFRSDEPRPDGPQGMALIRTIDTDPDADERESSEEASQLESTNDATENASSKRKRYWHWYARPRDAEDATRASTKPITWDRHTRDVTQQTREIVDVLRLPDGLKHAIILAAELHDLGKQREQWQRGIGNPNPTDWHAKPGKPDNGLRWRPQRLSDYRHEFGSVLDAQADEVFKQLGDEMKDLVLHLIAAHHGRARPHFSADEAFDPDRSTVETEALAIETPRRFARLQRRYGRWGLAYLESLLRAADWAASAEPSAYADDPEATS